MANKGAAFVFKIDGTSVSQIKKLISSEPERNAQFGTSVSISGNYIVIGSPLQDNDNNLDDNMADQGAAFVFKINNDTSVSQIKKIISSEPENYAWFGTSVAISGNYIVVGSPFQDNNPGDSITNQGAAFVFKYF